MESIIEVQDVTKSFKGATVLRQINISFEKGKIHGIIGRNGSGKTVLIKTICGLIHPDQGKVIVDGKVIGKDVDFPESIGAIIEAPGFLPSVSAFRNLSYLASLRGRIGRDEIRAAISFVGLDPDDKKAVGKYSLGMKQRLGLAQAIMEDPDSRLPQYRNTPGSPASFPEEIHRSGRGTERQSGAALRSKGREQGPPAEALFPVFLPQCGGSYQAGSSSRSPSMTAPNAKCAPLSGNSRCEASPSPMMLEAAAPACALCALMSLICATKPSA